MEEKVIEQKIARLKELLINPDQNEASVLSTFHDLFQLSHEGRDLSPEDAEWLNKTACFFHSLELYAVLIKYRLQVHGFQLTALSLTDVDDVMHRRSVQ